MGGAGMSPCSFNCFYMKCITIFSDIDRGGILELLRRNLDLNATAGAAPPQSSATSIPTVNSNRSASFLSSSSVVESSTADGTSNVLGPPAAVAATTAVIEPLRARTAFVVELDFFWDTFPPSVRAELLACDIILAADVVYDPAITLRFFRTLRAILGLGPKTALIAIERRERAAHGGGLAAPNFDLFTSQLANLHGLRLGEDDEAPRLYVSVEAVEPAQVPQHFHYSRVSQLTLWRIVSSLQP
jgi:hypothetical protein